MTEYGGAVCAPQAMLTEDGIPAMCEADVYGGLTALVLRELAGTDPFLADLVDADRGDDTSVMWHCGLASPSLADPKSKRRGTVHPNRDRALIFDFALRPGRVTVARLSQLRDGPAMVVGSGEMLPRDHPFAGTCGVMRWDSPIDGVLDTIFTRGIEHHYVIAYGDQRDALVALAGLWRIPVVHLT
jgi:L-fucose isomerase-like protein